MYGMKPRLPAMDRRRGADAGPVDNIRSSCCPVPAPRACRRRLAAGRGSTFGTSPGARAGTGRRAPATNSGRDSGRGQERATSRGPSDKGDQSRTSNDNGSTEAGRRRGNLPKTGEAAARTSPPPHGEHGGHGNGGVIVAGYPWWSSGFYGGYYAYDPWLGWYPTYDTTGSAGGPGSDDAGAVRLKVKPVEASVYVDGYYVGVVDDFDGVFQRLRLEPGPHHLEIRLAEYDDSVVRRADPPGAHHNVSRRPDQTPVASGFSPDAFHFPFLRRTYQYIGTPAAITSRPADATPGASTMVLITIAKLTMQKSAGAQG